MELGRKNAKVPACGKEREKKGEGVLQRDRQTDKTDRGHVQAPPLH